MAIQFDFDSIKQRLQNSLRAKTSWANILFYSTNMRLIDIVAEEIAYDMQYDEMLTREAKWNISRQISSIMAETKFFSYFPHRKIGAIGTIKVSTVKTFDYSYGINVDFPKYTIVSAGDIFLTTSESVSLLTNEQYKLISVVQGTPKIYSFTAQGSQFETFSIDNDSLDNNTYDVYVNNELYTGLDSIREATDGTQKVYTLSNNNDFSGVKLQFGDGYFGRNLVVGDSIVFKCIETLASSGNITSAGLVNTFVSKVYDTNRNSITVYCTNTEPIIGGLEYEDIETIRENAPKSYKSGDTAITKDDYRAIMDDFSFIKKVNVWGEAEVNEDLGNIPGTYINQEENVVHVSLVSTNDIAITPTQELIIRESINEKKSPTDIISFENPNFIYINFIVYAYVTNKNYTLSYVSSNIDTALSVGYSVAYLDFKTSIYQSDYISKVSSASGVGYHETSFNLFKYEYFISAYSAPININMSNIKPNSIKLYKKNDADATDVYALFGHDNGVGVLVGESGYDLSVSSIDYNTGIGNLIIIAGMTGLYMNLSIKVVFSTTNANIVPTKRNQFISYGSSSITVDYV